MISAFAFTLVPLFLIWGNADPDPGWELQATSSGAEIPRTCFKTPVFDRSTRGTFFISGPAKFEMGGIAFNSLFDGYGRINRFEFRESELCYTSAWINSSYYHAAVDLGKVGPGVLFDDTTPARPGCSFFHPMCDLTAPMDNNWVNMLPLGSDGLLITDAPLMLKIDFETLEVTGAYPWEDNPKHSVNPPWLKPFHAAAAGSAHPLPLPGSKSIFIALMQEAGPTELLDLYSIDTSVGKRRTLVASVPTKSMQYLHSFGLTENYAVLPLNIKMGMPVSPSKGMRPYLLNSFEDGWNGIKVVDLKHGKVLDFDTEKFFHVHIANTFENETGIVMDLGTGPVLPFGRTPQLITSMFLNKTLRDANDGTGHVMERFHFHLTGSLKGNVTRETFTSPVQTIDFFKINNKMNGKPYCIYYAVEWFHDSKAYASMAVLKHNLCSGKKTYWSRPNVYPGEPFFVPGESDDEEDGVITFVALDGQRRASDLIVLDGKSFQEVSVTQLPVHIPFLAHGQFFPAASLKDAEAAVEAPVVI